MIKILNKEVSITDIETILNKQYKASYDKDFINEWNRKLSIYYSQFKAYSDICIPCQSRKVTVDELRNHIDIYRLSKQTELTKEETEFIFEHLRERYE